MERNKVITKLKITDKKGDVHYIESDTVQIVSYKHEDMIWDRIEFLLNEKVVDYIPTNFISKIEINLKEAN